MINRLCITLGGGKGSVFLKSNRTETIHNLLRISTLDGIGHVPRVYNYQGRTFRFQGDHIAKVKSTHI